MHGDLSTIYYHDPEHVCNVLLVVLAIVFNDIITPASSVTNIINYIAYFVNLKISHPHRKNKRIKGGQIMDIQSIALELIKTNIYVILSKDIY